MANEPANAGRAPLVTYGDDKAIVIPCEPKQFGQFISGLLGKTQTITRRIRGPYEVQKDDVANISALISQRVSRQNDATLVSFSTLTSYSDGSSVMLNSLDEFLSYAEVKPLISTDLTLEWVFLIEFPGRPTPEKQELNVSFITFREYEDDENYREIPYLFSGMSPDCILIKIQHTDRTWGADIENLISNHLRLLLKPEKPWRKFMQKHAKIFGAALSLTIASATIFSVSKAAARIELHLSNITDSASSSGDALRAALEIAKSGVWDRFTLYSIGFVVLGLIVSLAVGMSASSSIEKAKKSYVLLTQKSTEQRDSEITKRERGPLYILAYAIGTVALGVMSNYAFSFALKVWQP